MKYSETLVPILVYFLAVTVTATGELRKVCVIFYSSLYCFLSEFKKIFLGINWIWFELLGVAIFTNISETARPL